MTALTPTLLRYREIPRHEGRPGATVGIAAGTAAVGVAVGIGQNVLNKIVAPYADFHFIGWDWVSYRWVAHLNLNVIDGILSGLLLATIFTVTTAIVTGRCCELKTGLRWFGIVIAADIAIWILGGLCAVIVALIHPAWPAFSAPLVPDVESQLRVAWVCGAVIGYELVGPVVLAGILIGFSRRWGKA